LNEKRDSEGRKEGRKEELLKEGRKGYERWKNKRWDERTIATTTRTPNPAMASPTGGEMINAGAPTATKYKLLASHAKDPSSHFNHFTEGSLGLSRLRENRKYIIKATAVKSDEEHTWVNRGAWSGERERERRGVWRVWSGVKQREGGLTVESWPAPFRTSTDGTRGLSR
jgi:hypothetical protein